MALTKFRLRPSSAERFTHPISRHSAERKKVLHHTCIRGLIRSRRDKRQGGAICIGRCGRLAALQRNRLLMLRAFFFRPGEGGTLRSLSQLPTASLLPELNQSNDEVLHPSSDISIFRYFDISIFQRCIFCFVLFCNCHVLPTDRMFCHGPVERHAIR